MSVKNNRTDDKPDKWIEKHKAQYKKSLKSNFPVIHLSSLILYNYY